VALGARGVYNIAIAAEEHWTNIEAFLKKDSDRPISLADACLSRCAGISRYFLVYPHRVVSEHVTTRPTKAPQ
jgi:hypothetical protein